MTKQLTQMPPDTPSAAEQLLPESTAQLDAPPSIAGIDQTMAPHASQLASLSQRMILEFFSPAAVLTNPAFEILYVSGPVENYLQLPHGDLLGAARDGLRSRLRSTLRQAIARNTTLSVDDARVKRHNTYHPVRFSVVPATGGSDGQALFLVVFEDIARAEARVEERLRKRTTRLRTLIAELALTEERERRMLARELHDDLGQVLAIVKIRLTSLEGCERRGSLKDSLKTIEELVDQANRSVRALMLQLSPPILQTLGLVPALEWLAEEMERLYGLAVRIDYDGEFPAIEEPARTTVFRAIRELLINVAKHANIDAAEVYCHPTDEAHVAVSVTDQGQGFDYQKVLTKPAGDSGFGLISVRERIEFIGGEMTVDTMRGYGTTISIAFPVKHGNELAEEQGNGNSDTVGGRSQNTP